MEMVIARWTSLFSMCFGCFHNDAGADADAENAMTELTCCRAYSFMG